MGIDNTLGREQNTVLFQHSESARDAQLQNVELIKTRCPIAGSPGRATPWAAPCKQGSFVSAMIRR